MGIHLSRWMEKINTLVKESPLATRSTLTLRLETHRSRSELAKRIISHQIDGSNDGDVRLKLGPTELISKPLHELLQPVNDVLRWNRPHRITSFLTCLSETLSGVAIAMKKMKREAHKSKKSQGFDEIEIMEQKHQYKLRSEIEKTQFFLTSLFN